MTDEEEIDPIHFRFSTEILARLGEELNSSLDQRILELVKNAYDADARSCMIQIENHGESTSISIIDDGDGMTVDQIKNGWLVLGASSKGKDKRTNLGRIPGGSKGLGRLAALRLGHSVQLRSYPKSQPLQEYVISIDWSRFESARLVEDVQLDVTPLERENEQISGTEITIKDVRQDIKRTEIKRLVRSLILLANPFEDDPDGFIPSLDVPEFKDLSDLLNKKYFEDADYHLVATVDKNGQAEAKVLDWKGKTLFKGGHTDLIGENSEGKYLCPPAKFDLWAFLLNASSFAPKNVTITEVREWLDIFGGVHLYENGLRVDPYGNEGNDWLDMNRQRVASPEERPSTNTVLGRVMVDETENLLIQKTDRSGFIESDEFLSLRQFARDALNWMAKKRMEVAEKRRAQERAEAPKKASRTKNTLELAIQGAPKKSREQITLALENFEKSKDKEISVLKKEVQLYRTLSTAGITAATFAHESSGNPIKLITQAIGVIERRSLKELPNEYDKKLKPPIESIKDSIGSLKVLGTFTLQLLEQHKRKLSRIDVHEVVNNIANTYGPFFEGRDVQLHTDFCEGSPYFRGSEAAMESIITNLINNSLTAFERQGVGERIINISTSIIDETVFISVDDSGPGLEGIKSNHIWLPGETTEANGTGLGLTIVRDSVIDLNGGVSVGKSTSLGGAQFVVSIPILGVD